MAIRIKNNSSVNNIRNVPFHILEQAKIRINQENPDNKVKSWETYLKSSNSWLDDYGIKDMSSWLYPQLMTLLSELKINRDPDTGMINGTKFWTDNIDVKSDWWKGLVRFIMIDPRGLTMKDKQYTSPGRQYCSLVPIVLAAHKLYNDVPYSHWDRSTLRSVVNKSLADAMLFEPEFEFTSEEILEIRDQGLTVKSGARSGQMNKPESTYKMFGIEDVNFKAIPNLAQVMLAQIWCAHPNNRTDLMVLDFVNWDKMPEKLADSNILIRQPSEQTESKGSELPWELD